MGEKPSCYECKYRIKLVGSASACAHPLNKGIGSNVFENYSIMFKLNGSIAQSLNVKGNLQGIRNGWFMWPADFDPTWLLTCDGFEKKEVV